MIKLSKILICLLLLTSADVNADPWNLPAKITNKTAQVNFEVDSTWHLVQGRAKEVAGQIWLSNPKDFRTIKAQITIPVALLDTDSSRRDKRMHEVMHSETSPHVLFTIEDPLSGSCSPENSKVDTPCRELITGILSINNQSKKVKLDSKITKADGNFLIDGTTTLEWADYGVDDPSILVAKLKPTVNVHFSITLPTQG